MFSTPVTNYRSIPVDVLTNSRPAWTKETFTQRGHRHEYFSERPDMSLRHCVASRGWWWHSLVITEVPYAY